MNKCNSDIYGRHSIRLKGYDYSQNGLYFITICTQNRKCLFGKIIDDQMVLNNTGKTAIHCWLEIPQHFCFVILREYVVMPNHVHGIIEIATPNTVGANYILKNPINWKNGK